MGSNREVDLQGNCSKCGGVHFGTGGEKPEPDTDIELTTEQLGRIIEQAAIQAERERCAKLIEERKYAFRNRTLCSQIAEAIRRGGEHEHNE